VWAVALERSWKVAISLAGAWDKKEGGGMTYSAHLAEAQRDDVGDKDDGAADDERHGRADVELVRPEGKQEL
jgi:hypothetical protein